jgi:hypothetical protein
MGWAGNTHEEINAFEISVRKPETRRRWDGNIMVVMEIGWEGVD